MTDQSPQEKTPLLNVVNVTEMKKAQKVRKFTEEEEMLWYNKPLYWVFGGCSLSVFFLLLSFSDRKFLSLTPVGPIAGLLSWYVRKLFK